MAKDLAKGVKKLTGGVNPKGFTGNKEAKKLKREGRVVGNKSKKTARKLGF
jgi:hypothetical protein